MTAGTGARKTNIFLKKFLTQQQITENFLDYLEEMGRGFFKETFAGQGLFTPIAAQVTFYASTVVDSFDIFVPLRGTDSLGHLLNLDASQAAQIKFENENLVDYFVGLRFNRLFQETEINVRNGQVKYSFFEEAIGELAEPNSVVDDLDETLTIVVDSIFEVGVSHAGRKVKVFLKKAVNEAGAFEDVTVIFSGGFNVIETTTALGQTNVSGISIDATDYQVFAIGPTVRRNTDLSLDPNILFLGKVQGKGAGNNPDVFDTSGIIQLFGGATQQLIDSLFSFLTGGGTITWELSTETLEWTSALKLILPHQPFDFTINPTSISNFKDGDVLYMVRDAIGGTKALIKVANGGVPNDPLSEPIVLRAGDNIYFKDGALELLGDSTSAVSGRIDGVTEDILSYICALNEADADPNRALSNGSTPLHRATSEKFNSIVKLLIINANKKANPLALYKGKKASELTKDTKLKTFLQRHERSVYEDGWRATTNIKRFVPESYKPTVVEQNSHSQFMPLFAQPSSSASLADDQVTPLEQPNTTATTQAAQSDSVASSSETGGDATNIIGEL